MPTIFTVAAALLGAAVGSFLNVVIYRLPLGLSIVSPPSSCPRCDTRISALQNIPVVSYILLRGRCAKCREPISIRYPLVEALTSVLTALLWLRFGEDPLLFGIYFIFMAAMVAVVFIDIDHKIIPDSISLGGIVLGFAASFFTPVGWVDSLIGIVAGAGSLFLVAWGYHIITGKEGMGMGDVKLLGAIGAFLGWQSVLFTIFVSSVTGSVVGVVALKLMGEGRDYEIPYGPFIVLGALAYLFRGPELIDWYLSLMG
ncbi:MAG: prepilin peptidase [Deltaproteobacteria bacterium]|nr:MAG: prepilin peptidase [Deltaproteobacteria bacterium]